MSETIYFNGKKYSSVAEMPSNIRKMYEKLNRFAIDDDKDGIPDIVQSGGLKGLKETVNMIKEFSQIGSGEGFEPGQFSLIRVTDTNIHINGKDYKNTAEMPENIRREYDRIVNNAQDWDENIFDESWRQVDRSEYFEPHDDEIFNKRDPNSSSYTEDSIEMVDSNGRFIFITIIAVLILGSMVTAWFLFF